MKAIRVKYKDCPQELKDNLPDKHPDDIYEAGGVREVVYYEDHPEHEGLKLINDRFTHSMFKAEIQEIVRDGKKFFKAIPREYMPCFLCNQVTCTEKPGPCPLNKDFKKK